MPVTKAELAKATGNPALPTYKTIAEVLERKTGSGMALVGYTIARSAFIAIPMRVVGVDWKRAIGGALLASTFISIFAVVRIYSAEADARASSNVRAKFKRRRQGRPMAGAGRPNPKAPRALRRIQ